MLAAHNMIPERLQRLEVAVANQAEENRLLSRLLVLVAKILGNLPVISSSDCFVLI